VNVNDLLPSHPDEPAPDQTGASSDAGGERFLWDLLVSRVLHPIQVAIIEALLWIDLPLSPADMARMFDGPYTSSHIAHHSGALAKLKVVSLVDTQKVRGATKHFYALRPEYTRP
jgi:hypothetical protein